MATLSYAPTFFRKISPLQGKDGFITGIHVRRGLRDTLYLRWNFGVALHLNGSGL